MIGSFHELAFFQIFDGLLCFHLDFLQICSVFADGKIKGLLMIILLFLLNFINARGLEEGGFWCSCFLDFLVDSVDGSELCMIFRLSLR